MRTDRSSLRGLRGLRGLVLALALGGCAPTTWRADLVDVANHSGHERAELPSLWQDVLDDQTADREIARLLAEPLDANAAVRVALLDNRELRARLLELGVARGQLIQARTVANPHLEVEVLPERNSDIEIAVEYEITSLVLAPARAKAARADLEAARLEVAGEVVGLGQRVRVAFYELQAAHQQLAIAQRTLDAFAAGRDAAQAMAEAGNLTPLDATAQSVAYERARIMVAQLELQLAERRERVQTLLGRHGKSLDWRAVETLPAVPAELPDAAGIEARAVGTSLELAAAQHRIGAAAHRVDLARLDGWMPDVELDVHALYAGRDEVTAPWGVGGGISVELPLFDRGRGTVVARKAELASLVQRREGTGVEVRSAARRVRNQLVSAHARALHFQEVILPAQRQVTVLTVLQYNAMDASVFAVLQARRDELETELGGVEALREFWCVRATFDALLAGRTVASDVETPASTPRRDSEGDH